MREIALLCERGEEKERINFLIMRMNATSSMLAVSECADIDMYWMLDNRKGTDVLDSCYTRFLIRRVMELTDFAIH